MKHAIKIFALGLSTLMVTGCVGTGEPLSPNNATQAGVATGAVAGAVIGYNTGKRNKGTRAVVGAALGAAAGGAIGQSIDNQNQQPAQTGGWQ